MVSSGGHWRVSSSRCAARSSLCFFLFHPSNICNFKLCIGLFSSFLIVSFFAFFYGSLSISGHPFDIVYTFVFFSFRSCKEYIFWIPL